MAAIAAGKKENHLAWCERGDSNPHGINR